MEQSNKASGRTVEEAAAPSPSAAENEVLIPKSDRPTYELARPVFFVGFMVAGKTSVSRRLARSCGVASVDLDGFIERREGKPINQMFVEIGEDGFRAMETAALDEFAEKDPMLISCGGGIVLRPENREILKSKGFVVYLQVTAEQAYERIGDVSTRPNFRDLPTARKDHPGAPAHVRGRGRRYGRYGGQEHSDGRTRSAPRA